MNRIRLDLVRTALLAVALCCVLAGSTTPGALAAGLPLVVPLEELEFAPRPSGKVLRVGEKHKLKRPSEAAEVARDGDTVEIDAGTFEGDVAVWLQNDLTLRSVGGRVHLKAAGQAAEKKAIWVIKGKRVKVDGIEFSGTRVQYENGAGIRHEGFGLIVTNCRFYDNENGILSWNDARNEILIEHSEFDLNGFHDGQAHNMYIGKSKSLTLRFNTITRGRGGSNVKTRALESRILYNYISDGPDGVGSYGLDLSNGGQVYVVGNVIYKNAGSQNPHVISFAHEAKGKIPNSELFLVNNTLISRRYQGRFLRNRADRPIRAFNNVLAGQGDVSIGPVMFVGNVLATRVAGPDADRPRILYRNDNLNGVDGSRGNVIINKYLAQDPDQLDFRPSYYLPPAAIPLVSPPDRVSLMPRFEYLPSGELKPRAQTRQVDAGAYSYAR